MNRDRRKEEVEKAYQIQVEAGLRGAAQYGAVGLGLAAIAHHSWPAFRCVRLAATLPLVVLTCWVSAPLPRLALAGDRRSPSKHG